MPTCTNYESDAVKITIEGLAGKVSPVGRGSQFLRVDQGVDWDARGGDVVAVGSGTVYHVSDTGPGGTFGYVIYQRLDVAVSVGGNYYDAVYYAEQPPLVTVGRVHAGQAVMQAGTNEIGFACGDAPCGPLVGGLGAGTQAVQEGCDFGYLAAALGAPMPASFYAAVAAGKGPPPSRGEGDGTPKRLTADQGWHTLMSAYLRITPQYLFHSRHARLALRKLTGRR